MIQMTWLPLGKTVAMPDEFSPDHLAAFPGLGSRA